MRTILLSLLLLVLNTAILKADDWGSKGHRATAAIATQYLNNKTQREIKKLLGEETLVVISTYADEVKSYDEYRKYGSWHYVNIAPGLSYAEAEHNKYGDIVMGIEKCKDVLTSETASKEDKVFYLKLLVHFIGDLHQPLHLGHADDKGGNDFQVRWFNDGTNLHSLWDSKMIESYGMSYSELAENYGSVSKAQYRELTKGNILDWVAEGQDLAEMVYNSAEIGAKLSYRYQADHIGIVQNQLQKGGVRLASVLNEIFG
ncbi:S1/P1 nuclease [Leeuwenhoekiella marinoflava]|uniref:S1/P1 nuclease n=2 Tax=Leeuwenhoekiella marinoflava TaxID=988 RepID=A0A4Q0PG87_9FLAO|nr:S1/P1 nuclease [Leeuwenhoekiella marinoflava]RXG25935.1 S1/P1 nuclease [Leeuwenhoekiella marinoflava]SHF73500.1 S1/P1 Nuclease [Leeuwenhoekiella marinoflava DSM 3653]